MQALDLEDEEWDQFANGIAQLAAQRERKPKDFKLFQVGLSNSMVIVIIPSIACFPAGLQGMSCQIEPTLRCMGPMLRCTGPMLHCMGPMLRCVGLLLWDQRHTVWDQCHAVWGQSYAALDQCYAV